MSATEWVNTSTKGPIAAAMLEIISTRLAKRSTAKRSPEEKSNSEPYRVTASVVPQEMLPGKLRRKVFGIPNKLQHFTATGETKEGRAYRCAYIL